MTRYRSQAVRVMAAVMTVVAALSMAGCASGPLGLPVDGGVLSLAPAEQQTRRVYTNPQGPSAGAQPETIVEGFYDAMPAGVQSDGFRVAHEFLTDTAGESWDGDEGAVIYDGTPVFKRRANTMGSSQGVSSSLIIAVELHIIGTLDERGLYSAVDGGQTSTITYTLVKDGDEWRIDGLEQGVVISSADFEQVFRQVSVYQVAASGIEMVPDVRWFSWRNWRVKAVRELLRGGAEWMRNALAPLDVSRVRLAVNSVPLTDNTPQVEFDDGIDDLSPDDRATLVRLIRLTLGDGNAQYEVSITSSGVNYSEADANVDLTVATPDAGVYTLTGGRVVALASSSALRVGEIEGYSGARGFVFSTSGGALLAADGTVECLSSDVRSCGVMFSGSPMRSIAGGVDGEIWAVSEDGRSLYVVHGGTSSTMDLDWLDSNASISAVALSVEGGRLALAVRGGGHEGVVLSGVSRDSAGMPTGLSGTVLQASVQAQVGMVTFYNDTTLVYATAANDNDDVAVGTGQQAFRQIAPGPDTEQRLPDRTVTAMTSGQVAQYRRLAVLDDTGVVRSSSGSLDGSWTVADSQVDALGAR